MSKDQIRAALKWIDGEIQRVNNLNVPTPRVYETIRTVLQSALDAQEDMVMVPREPTQAMKDAASAVDAFSLGSKAPIGFRIYQQGLFADCYRAMVAAVEE